MRRADIWGALSGCVGTIVTAEKSRMTAMVNQLMTCESHKGIHHFAIVGQGQTLFISKAGISCLEEKGLIPPC